MLAYVFWHTRAEGAGAEAYERALEAFQRSLARTPPFGFRGSAVFRIGVRPWEAGRHDGDASASLSDAPAPPLPSYEDWYLVEDFAALGVLNEAAVGRGHRSSHDRAARGLADATAGLYRLIEGEPSSASDLAACEHATWVTPARGRGSEIGALLGDGLDPDGSSVWQRQLVLGPAPEFCVLSRGRAPGAASTRLAASWSAVTSVREVVFGA
jgi:hypothetical protein